MAAVHRVLIIGGGFAGMSAAIQLRKTGAQVTLAEVDPNWRPEGAGISISGATLRALKTVGVYEEVKANGFLTNNLDVYTPTGQRIAQIPKPSPVGANVEGSGGIMRPVLAHILADATRAAGVDIRLGITFSELAPDTNGVDVTFSDGTYGRYDLVIGADGVHSKVRETVFPEVQSPHYIGQGVWRAVMPRPSDIVCTTMWVGSSLKIGVNPVSKSHMYMFITENRPTRERVDRASWPQVMADLVGAFPADALQRLIPEILKEDACVDYRPLVNLLVPCPWHRGRIVLIGDTVHATTPHLASGAGIGIESAIVLAETLNNASQLDEALSQFGERRWERCRMVVENSAKLAEIEITDGDKTEHAAIMRQSTESLLQPI